MNRDAAYLTYVKGAVRKIESFTAGMDAAAFMSDEKTQSAVILQLMLIGEMAKRISEKTRLSVGIPWKEIARFRDRAIHDYFEMDLEIIWRTVVQDIPTLKTELKEIK